MQTFKQNLLYENLLLLQENDNAINYSILEEIKILSVYPSIMLERVIIIITGFLKRLYFNLILSFQVDFLL